MSGVSENKPPANCGCLAGCGVPIGPTRFPWALKGSEEGEATAEDSVAVRIGP